MKKKLVILFVIGVSISILVSCFPTEYYLIKDFELYGVELTNPNEKEDENKVFRNVSYTLEKNYILVYLELQSLNIRLL